VDLQYDSTHEQLRDSAARFLRDRYDHRTFLRISESEAGWSPEIWAEFAQLGWLGLPFAEEHGGSEAGDVEIGILMQEFGKALVVEPFIATVILGGGLIAALGSQDQRTALLEPVVEGKSRLALAIAGRDPTVSAVARGTDFALSGSVKGVSAAPIADTILVPARLPSGGTGVFIVPANSRGLTVRAHRTIDGGRAADVTLTDATLPKTALLGGNEDAADAIDMILDRAIAALSADAVGAIATMVASTVDYTKTRVQFGQPIAKFQVIQHRLVQLKIREEEARASSLLATLSLDGAAANRVRAVSGAKAKIGRCARFVAQDAIQLHGAIGTTNELPLGFYARRLIAYEARFGTTREHLRRYAAAISDPALAGAGLLLAK
jgi:alkylation response protein AidB-like acyl-CoA dehydrogenase